FSAQVGYLPGLSAWSLHVFPVFTRGFLHEEPKQKNMLKNRTLSCPSLTKTDGSLDLVPARHKGCPLALGALEKGQSRMGKCRGKIHCDLFGMCVCVCVLYRHSKMHVCAADPDESGGRRLCVNT